jgi:hypothetical protein
MVPVRVLDTATSHQFTRTLFAEKRHLHFSFGSMLSKNEVRVRNCMCADRILQALSYQREESISRDRESHCS